eukprot:TRINITY_DN7416_c0_g1_i1.p1 TRINITY_DN7416_c0_g1~~TRINITY_DN7416_c0_g1_i1.p1  ORF type:complete len:250 (+),score=13.45 TRINITY_DN7416_c0_g1_i1:77-826(+)
MAKLWKVFGCFGLQLPIVFNVLLIVHLDAHRLIWPTVFIPLWIGLLLGLGVLIATDINWTPAGLFWLTIPLLCFTTFTGLLVAKIYKENWGTSWWGVFTPIWVGLFFLLLVEYDWPEYEFKFISDPDDDDLHVETLIQGLPKQLIVATGIFCILLALRLERVVVLNWAIIFLPYIVVSFLVLVMLAGSGLIREEDVPGWWLIFGFLPFFAFELLLILYLENKIKYFAIVSIPLYFIDIILFVCSFIIVC